MADGVCGTGLTEQTGSNTTMQNLEPNREPVAVMNGQISSEKPCLKRPRLSDHVSNAYGMSNGFAELNKDAHRFTSPPTLPGVTKALRDRFDAKFKLSLREKLASYLSMIEHTEQSINTLKDEMKQLKGRMDCIETSSEQLTKLITDRLPLPNPTNADGQQRQISSQAPRLPPPPPLVSAPDGLVSKQPISNPVSIGNTPISTAQISIPFSNQSVITALLTSPLTPVKVIPARTSDVEPNTRATPARLVDIQATDTIDLTNDTSAVDFVDDTTVTGLANVAKVPRDNVLSNLSNNPTLTTKPTSISCPIQDPKQQQQPLQQLSNTVQDLLPVKKTAPVTNFITQRINFVPDVHLPVARLPPIPAHPNTGSFRPTPVQPVPQLTIAEATEGICLQWTIGSQNHIFEPASAYEIYSYASSEVTMDSLKTHLPWKKVGQVIALPLPMACTLTHVQPNNMYYFIVRSMDRSGRYSEWSNVVNAYVS